MAQLRRIFTALAAAALLGPAPRAGAQEATPPVVQMEAAADRNADERIDREEFHHHALELFFRADRDADLRLDPRERQDPPTRELSGGAGEGALSLWDYAGHCLATFRAADADRDGALGPGEVELRAAAPRSLTQDSPSGKGGSHGE